MSQTVPWLAEGIRLTAFPSSEVSDASLEWCDFTAEESERREQRKKEALTIEEGSYGNGRLRLLIRPTRLDWQYVPDEEKSETTIPTIGSVSDVVNSFSDSAKWWLRHKAPDMERVAFGVVLSQFINDWEEGLKTLQPLLPHVDIDTGAIRDFKYMVNRRRASNVIHKLEINRLNTWSVSERQLLSVQVSQSSPRPEHRMRSQFVSGLELDVNTAPEWVGLEREYLEDVFNELVMFGLEIANRGDVP